MALRWTSALAIGAAELDARHEELFRRVERLHDAMLAHDRTEVARLLEFLIVYVREHFEAEEALMRRIGYPLLEQHAAEHAAFAAAVAELYEALARDGLTARLVLAVDRRVTGWLADHVYTSDLALGRFSAGRSGPQGPGSSPGAS
jgi:hemerythrin